MGDMKGITSREVRGRRASRQVDGVCVSSRLSRPLVQALPPPHASNQPSTPPEQPPPRASNQLSMLRALPLLHASNRPSMPLAPPRPHASTKGASDQAQPRASM